MKLSDKTINPKYKDTIEYIQDKQSHYLDYRLVCVDCGRIFEHLEIGKASGKIAKELTRIAYPHPNRVYPDTILLCDSIKLLDAARADFPKPPLTLFSGTTYQHQIETDGEYKNRVWLWYCKWFGAP